MTTTMPEASAQPRRRSLSGLRRAPSARAAGVGAAALVLLALAAVPAGASGGLGEPSGVRLSAVTPSGFTVTASRAANAAGYQLFASTTKSDVYVANIARARHSALAPAPVVSLTGLPYATAPYYYRFAVVNGTRHTWSDILSVGLQPPAPTDLRAASSRTGTSLSWRGTKATGYAVTQASDSAMTRDRRTYTLRSLALQFTPYGLTPGRRYWFEVRSLNATTRSRPSSRTSVVAVPAEQSLRIMTYNVLEADAVGKPAGDGVAAPWSQRRAGVVKLIREANPDVLAVQEAAAWVGAVKGPRQVDDLVAALGGSYLLARTETPPNEPHYMRTGRYVLYKASAYRAVGTGGHWLLSEGRFAPYQLLENRATGTRLVAVSVHLEAGGGADADARRESQAKALIAQASAYGKQVGAPVVYAGDFNSHLGSNHVFDGPGIAFRAVHHTDGLQVAQTLTNAQYNSANQYLRTPPASGLSLDHVYAPPGVAIRSWHLWLDLQDGRLVGTIPSDHNPLSADITIPYAPRVGASSIPGQNDRGLAREVLSAGLARAAMRATRP